MKRFTLWLCVFSVLGVNLIFPDFLFGDEELHRVWINYLYERGEEAGLLREGMELRSGDHWAVQFMANHACYVHVYQVDSAGTIQRCYPLERFGEVVLDHSERIRAEAVIFAPSEKLWFRLDETTGKETIIFVASTRPLEDYERAFSRYRKSRDVHSPAPKSEMSEVGKGQQSRENKKSVCESREELFALFRPRGIKVVDKEAQEILVKKPNSEPVDKEARIFMNIIAEQEGMIVDTVFFKHN